MHSSPIQLIRSVLGSVREMYVILVTLCRVCCWPDLLHHAQWVTVSFCRQLPTLLHTFLTPARALQPSLRRARFRNALSALHRATPHSIELRLTLWEGFGSEACGAGAGGEGGARGLQKVA